MFLSYNDSQVVSDQASCLVTDREEPNEEDPDSTNGDGEHCEGDPVVETIAEVQARNNKDENDGTARCIV